MTFTLDSFVVKRGGLTLCLTYVFSAFFYSEESAVGNLSPFPQHWADSAQKTAAIQVDMTEYLAVWIHKKMTWGDLCAVASAAADLLDWLADRNAWVEQKKNKIETQIEKKSVKTRRYKKSISFSKSRRGERSSAEIFTSY